MSRAEELARHLEEGAFAPNILQNENAVRVQSAAELRRLAQVEAEHEALKKAISDAVPVAWIDMEGSSAVVSAPRLYSDGSSDEAALYTLEGIRTKP